MTAPLEVFELRKNYDSLEALKGLSFAMKEGEVFGLLGPNGAGKTTLISILTQIERPTSGTAKVFGDDVTLAKKEMKAKIGFVPQETVNHGFFSLEEVLEFQSGYYGLGNNRKQIDYLIDRLALGDCRRKKILQLSGGMKRRFLIAKALVHQPKLLLLDEPTAGVDIDLRNSLWQFVRELNQQGTSVLLTTHYLEEAEKLCHRVGIINHGELKRIGPTESLVQELTEREVVLTLQEPREITSPFLVKAEGKKLYFRIPYQKSLGELLMSLRLDQSLIIDIKIREGSLEDAFLQILKVKK